MPKPFCIDDRLISDETECYVIAEIGHNHQGNVETCKEMIRAAREAGASAVKLQKRENRTLYTKAFYNKPYEHENSYGATYGEHREFLEFGWDEYRDVQAFSRELGITFFSTAFDHASADFLAKLDVPAYKLASADLTNTPLLKHVASFGKPMLVSTGGGTMDDVQRAYDTIMPINEQLCIIQCTAGYPCAFEELNLRVIETFRRRFPDTVTGLSAHDNGIAMSVVAFALGARVVEKHFTLNRAMKGTDHAFSLEKQGLQKLVRDLQRARVALGDGVKRQYASEKGPLTKMAKKIVAAKKLPIGHILTREDLAFRSPGDGLAPHYLEHILGAVTLKVLDEDDGITFDNVRVADEVWDDISRQPAATIEEQTRRVQLVAFDFDGVFTDNEVHVTQDGVEVVTCNRGDGFGLKRLKESGANVVVISTETNPVVSARCKKLGLRCVQGCNDKLSALKRIAQELGTSLSECAFVGNDVNDLECLSAVGLPIVVHDAHADVIAHARFRTRTRGGHGAVREVCDLICDAKQAAATHEGPKLHRRIAA